MITPESPNPTANDKMCQRSPVGIGATCVAELAPNVFVLLVEVEVEVPGEDIQEVLIIRLTPAQAAALIPEVGRCLIIDKDDPVIVDPGAQINLICVFVFGENAFLVYDVETNTTDRLVLVRIPLCPIV
ncbi:spore coat protein [Clostridium peptidivorans]|uniref:spore coat protein n=1 Tax=Clostridium peptidivorans TaxID=100174 RepID=UPI000BE39F8F|nr:spore coat protein [Clostridium peptidivorans]